MNMKIGPFGTWLIVLLSPATFLGQATKIDSFPSSSVTKNQDAHKVTIERVTKNAGERKALQIAESTYPEKSTIQKDCPRLRETDPAIRKLDSRRWWCETSGGILIPYAITRSAVAYYVDISDKLRLGKLAEAGQIKMRSSSLRYNAVVVPRATYTVDETVFSNVYEITMALGWEQYCGPRCAMSFSLERTVIISQIGEVLLVKGDERTLPLHS
jgi:hypothetical protein